MSMVLSAVAQAEAHRFHLNLELLCWKGWRWLGRGGGGYGGLIHGIASRPSPHPSPPPQPPTSSHIPRPPGAPSSRPWGRSAPPWTRGGWYVYCVLEVF